MGAAAIQLNTREYDVAVTIINRTVSPAQRIGRHVCRANTYGVVTTARETGTSVALFIIINIITIFYYFRMVNLQLDTEFYLQESELK